MPPAMPPAGGTDDRPDGESLPARPARVAPHPLTRLAALVGVTTEGGEERDPFTGGDGAVAVTGVTHDSRLVRPGDLYAALPGRHHHGALFCREAAAAGAVAVLTDPDGAGLATASGLPVLVVGDVRGKLGEVASWVYGRPSQRLLLIGVTGTSGKTTTTYLLESGLRRAGHVSGLIGGVEVRAGQLAVPGQLTTPESTDLQALLAVMAERGVTAAAMEVSSHALALGRAAGTSFDVAVFTNLSQDHLDFHASMDEYFAAKAELFTSRYARAAVVNFEDPRGRELARRAEIPVTTFSAEGSPRADWRAADVRCGADGSSFRVVGPGGIEADATISLIGPFNVANALAAVVALVEAGVPLQGAVDGVAACPGVPGRLERVQAPPGQDFTVLVDYSHKPAAVEAVLRALRPVTLGKLAIVLGCGGDRDASKRQLMGAAAASLADVAILTSDNPRSEDPLAILAAMLAGAVGVDRAERAHVIVEPDRAAAIRLAIAGARKGDVVLVAGKGHERGQYGDGVVVPFDDREVAASAAAETAAARAAAGAAGEPPSIPPASWQEGEDG